MTTILVTGGAGYIGSHVVYDLIDKGYDIIVFDNLVHGHREVLPDNVKFIQGDLKNQESVEMVFKKHKIDAVMHFAAFAYVGESVKDPSKYFRNNVAGGLNLLDSMVGNEVKYIIFSSSCAVYGVPNKIPIKESEDKKPISPYGWTKLIFEKMLESYEKAYGIKYISLRYFNAAGARPDGKTGEWHIPETHVIPLILKTILGERKEFEVYGNDYPTKDGTCIRDYIHVCDLSNAHIKALEYLMGKEKSDEFNLGTGKGVSVLELIKIAEEVTGVKLNYSFSERRHGDPSVLVADPSKANKTLKWDTKYKIKDIVRHAWGWEKKMNHLRMEVE